jgi:hypothetical protein
MALPVGSATSRNGYEELQYANPCCTPRPQIPAKASRARETIWYRSRTWSSRWVSYKLKSENTIERPWGGVRWWVYGGRVACGVCRRGYGRSLRWWPWILVRKEERESEQGEETKVKKWEKAGNKMRLWIYITYIYIYMWVKFGVKFWQKSKCRNYRICWSSFFFLFLAFHRIWWKIWNWELTRDVLKRQIWPSFFVLLVGLSFLLPKAFHNVLKYKTCKNSAL